MFLLMVDEKLMPQTIFLKNMTISDPKSDAQVLSDNLFSVLQQEGLSVDRLKVFGSDDAAVMVGRKSGVATGVKQKSLHCINIHCTAHRFNLCTLQASKISQF